ncbi:MAG: HAD-IG family 5'-nucleotidase, partial [Actinomycetota bacterium]|nr:HAD-IG family 5'-nucleotidase [Actinomycetota bacterium]
DYGLPTTFLPMPTDAILIPDPSPERRVFVNRTLNMRSIKAIGYDMDYTLTQYNAEAWEECAFGHARARLAALGWPVEALEFDATMVSRGLVMDLELGNLLKGTRFGWVIRAMHGTRFFDYHELRRAYSGTLVDLAEDRYVFLNTLFSLSEASLFAQCVELLDAGELPSGVGYREVFAAVRAAIDGAHRDGLLKADVLADPERFIVLDGDIVDSLLDQKHAGKRMMLITNSEWNFANEIMTYTFDRYLPTGHTWRDLFGTVIVSAAKPGFFTSSNPLYKVVDEDRGLLEPHHGSIEHEGIFYGGNARLVEEYLGLSGDEILYVGDHLYGDVHFSKDLLRWRTALILQELESEVRALSGFLPSQQRLGELMAHKEHLEAKLSALRLAELRARDGYAEPMFEVDDGEAAIVRTRNEILALDDVIAPLAIEAGRLRTEAWGLMMRAGADKSLLARQVERYADIYTSRVSNLLYPGPYAMFRIGRLDLPHDPQN